jgi:proteasome lid subunit RPN8/RPN11
MSDSKFGSWSAPESPITIEYSLVVIEEIRHEVAEGFQRLSRGGIEVGGVLYGTRDGRTVRVQAMRPIACEHARGPGFVFSDKDRVALNEQLLRDKDDPHLEGLISVGWFLSHTRSEIALSDSDLEIYSIFFPAPWQITLVVRPGRAGSMRAGFFVRETDGTAKNERSYLEFNFPDRLAGVLDRVPERVPRERPERRIPAFYRESAAIAPAPAETHAPASEPELPTSFQQSAGPQLLKPTAPRKKWPWLVAWFSVVAVAAVIGLRYWMLTSAAEPMSLALVERDGQLQVEWNRAAKPVAGASMGTLEIIDGPDSKTIRITPQQLASGHFTYVRKTGDIEVRMTVEDASGGKVQEASRFLGRAPAAAASSQELTDLQRRRDELEAEVARLRRQNDDQTAKIQQLERTLRVLQARLGIDSGKQ